MTSAGESHRLVTGTALIVIAALQPNCFQWDNRVQFEPDGSGTYEMSMEISSVFPGDQRRQLWESLQSTAGTADTLPTVDLDTLYRDESGDGSQYLLRFDFRDSDGLQAVLGTTGTDANQTDATRPTIEVADGEVAVTHRAGRIGSDMRQALRMGEIEWTFELPPETEIRASDPGVRNTGSSLTYGYRLSEAADRDSVYLRAELPGGGLPVTTILLAAAGVAVIGVGYLLLNP